MTLTWHRGFPTEGISLWPWPDTSRESPCRGKITMTLTWQTSREILQRAYHNDFDLTLRESRRGNITVTLVWQSQGQRAYHYDLDLTQYEGVPAEGKSLRPWHKKAEGPCWGHITMTLTWQTSREFLQRAYHYDLNLTVRGSPRRGHITMTLIWHRESPTEGISLLP